MTRPLATYMDEISLVETIRHRLHLRDLGLKLEGSQCKATLENLLEKNLNVVSGKLGEMAVSDLFDILNSPEDSDIWLQWLGSNRLKYNECFPLVVMALCQAWRRLVFPYQAFPYLLFRLAVLDPLEAYIALASHKQSLNHASTATCLGCQDPSFTKVMVDFVFQTEHNRERRVKLLQEFLKDGLRELPASTVQVEKLHANVQNICRSDRGHAPRQKTVQVNTYIMGTCQEHASLKAEVERDVFGADRRRVLRLLSARVLQSSAPAELSVRKQKARKAGLSLLNESGCRNHTLKKKSRRTSAYNAFIQEHRCGLGPKWTQAKVVRVSYSVGSDCRLIFL